MKALQDLAIFVEAAKHGSLTGAARQLDVSPAVASAAIKRLETELGSPLFVRSTRSLRLTQQGEQFLRYSEQALDLLQQGQQQLQNADKIQGSLLISAPSDLGRDVILPLLDVFMSLYPNISTRLSLSDEQAKLFSQPIDIAIRYGVLGDSSMIAMPLVKDNRRVLVASPEYLAQHKTPAHPLDLKHHECLFYELNEVRYNRWQFYRQEEEIAVSVTGRRASNDGGVVRQWALSGKGIAYKSALDVKADLNAGRLVPLCTDWQGELAPLHLLCPSRQQLTPAVKALHRFLRDQLA